MRDVTPDPYTKFLNSPLRYALGGIITSSKDILNKKVYAFHHFLGTFLVLKVYFLEEI